MRKYLYVFVGLFVLWLLLPVRTNAYIPTGCVVGIDCPTGYRPCEMHTDVCCQETNHDALCANVVPDTPAPAGSTSTGWLQYCDSGQTLLQTAVGCVPVRNFSQLAVWLGAWVVGIGGGIAFILILVGAFQIITSGGNPDQLKAGQQLLTAAISGLVFIIFSVFIFRLIGVDILRLPGLVAPGG